MTRLVVQHPQLTDLTVKVFEAAVGAPPQRRWSGGADWLEVDVDGEQVTTLAEIHRVDAEICPPADRLSDYGLLAFDMDSTLIDIECIDELAKMAGQGEAVARITEAAMRGEITSFADSLRARLALLAGTPAALLERVYHERLHLNPGAERLIELARAAGLRLLLVSGGFTFYTERLRERLGLDMAEANELVIENGRLTGEVHGPILDAEAKRAHLLAACSRLGIPPTAAIAIGDGANDLLMMGEAGVSVAYHAKPIVRSETTHAVSYCGLDAVLNFFVDTAPEPLTAG